MNESEDIQGRDLWRKHSAALALRVAGRAEPPIDANVLAAYLDGTADAKAVAQVEARMARDDEFLREVMELRAMQQASATPAPSAVVERAQRLVAETARPACARPAPTPWHGWWGRLQWAAVAAGILMACWAGYASGRGTLRAQRAQASAAQSSAQSIVSEPDSDLPAAQPNPNGGAL